MDPKEQGVENPEDAFVQDKFYRGMLWANNLKGVIVKDCEGQLIFVPPIVNLDSETEDFTKVALGDSPLTKHDLIPTLYQNLKNLFTGQDSWQTQRAWKKRVDTILPFQDS